MRRARRGSCGVGAAGALAGVLGRVPAAVLAAVLAVAVVACGGSPGSSGPALSPTASILPPATSSVGPATSAAASISPASPGSAAPSAPGAVSSPVVGVVVAVDSAGLGSVSGFTLRLTGGAQVRFRVTGALENAAQFPLGHLSEHLATAAPVRVFFRTSGDLLVAYRIEDAG